MILITENLDIQVAYWVKTNIYIYKYNLTRGSMKLHLVTPPQPICLYRREEGSVPEPHHYTFEKFEFDNSGKIQQINKPKDKQESHV